jgi:hypothetical protein
MSERLSGGAQDRNTIVNSGVPTLTDLYKLLMK